MERQKKKKMFHHYKLVCTYKSKLATKSCSDSLFVSLVRVWRGLKISLGQNMHSYRGRKRDSSSNAEHIFLSILAH